MAILRAQIQLALNSGTPEDRPVNVLHFDSPTTPAVIADIVGHLNTFYSAFQPQLANTVAQNGHQIKWYNMDDPAPRAPIAESTFNLAFAPNSAPLPSEIAVCCSFQALRVSGLPQARRRGRIFIGPLGTVILSTNGRPVTSGLNQIKNAADAFLAASQTSTNWKWVVRSVAGGGTVSEISDGWLDDAFDVQRRRGVKPSSRVLFS